MARLIDMDALYYNLSSRKMTELYPNWREMTPEVREQVERLANEFRLALVLAPAIDAVQVVHAKWKWEGRFKACSECGTYIDLDNTLGASHWRYCPNCGAKMDGDLPQNVGYTTGGAEG